MRYLTLLLVVLLANLGVYAGAGREHPIKPASAQEQQLAAHQPQQESYAEINWVAPVAARITQQRNDSSAPGFLLIQQGDRNYALCKKAVAVPHQLCSTAALTLQLLFPQHFFW